MERRMPAKGMMLHKGRRAPSSLWPSEAQRGRGVRFRERVKMHKTESCKGFLLRISQLLFWDTKPAQVYNSRALLVKLGAVWYGIKLGYLYWGECCLIC